MSIFSKIKSSVQTSDASGDITCTEREKKTVAFIVAESNRRRAQRLSYELQWKLNTNFFYGNQHCDINSHRMTVENYQPVYDYLSREVFNRIAPLLETRLANLQTVRYNMTVLPRTNEYEDALKASVSTALLRAKQEASDFQSKLDSAIHWCELTGSAFFLAGWNAEGGESLLVPKYKNAEESKRFSVGDVEYCVLTPYEVLPDNIACESVEGQHSILIEQIKSVAEIETLYGITVSGSVVDTLCYRPIGGAGGYGYEAATLYLDTEAKDNSVLLYTYMERPSVVMPEGRLVIVAGDTLIFDGALPYRDIPLSQMKCHVVPGQFYGRSVIENLIPLQRSYNGIKNKINDYINMAATGQMLIEEGSLDTEDLEGNGIAPGIPVVYTRGSEKPELLPVPTLPSVITEQCDRIASDMEYVAGVSQLMVSGIAPSGITSGTAINTLRRIDSTRLSLTADNIRQAVRKLAVIWLQLYHDFGGTHRVLMASGSNEYAGVLYWSAEQINSFEVIYETENELKDSNEERYQRLLSAIELGLYNTPDGKVSRKVLRKARESMGIENYGVTLEEDLQEQNARMENINFEKGEELRVFALDDHRIHLEEHRLYSLQKVFRDIERKEPQKAERMYAHIEQHTNALKKEGLSLVDLGKEDV